MGKGNWKCSFVLLSKLALKTNKKTFLSWNFIPCLHAQKVESEKGKSIFVLFKDFLYQHQTNTKKGQKFHQIFVFVNFFETLKVWENINN